jgi:hypothetical protein
MSILRFAVVCAGVSTLVCPAFAQQPVSVTVAPWSISTTYKADKFENCTMTLSTSGVGVDFIRNGEGLLLSLDSSKWKLERGKDYNVRLSAGSESVDAKALAETKSITIALADKSFNVKLRAADLLEVRGEGATIQVPLEGSAAGLERLDQCFDKNSKATPETNPFVAPARQP